jgi:mRNA interferase YafQ
MNKFFLDDLSNERTKYDIAITAQFRKDYKRAKKRGLKMEALAEVVIMLANGEALPATNRDHNLSGNWIGHRECHILPDWLLIYRIEDDVLVLTLARTGTHSDLLEK